MSSLDELEREAGEYTTGFGCVMTHLQAGASFEEIRPEIRFKRSLERARQVQVEENVLTQQFLDARSSLNQDGDSFQPWTVYKENCQSRHHIGQLLRSNMDWDWDLSSALERLFKVSSASPGVPTVGSEVQLKGTDVGSETALPQPKEERARRKEKRLQKWSADVKAEEEWWEAKTQESIASRRLGEFYWRSTTLH